MVSTLLKRASTHCSKREQELEEKQNVFKALEQNGYPRRFVFSRSQASHHSKEKEKPTLNGFAVIPYVQCVCEAISRVLRDVRIKVCFKPMNTLRRLLSRPKDVIPLWSKSNVVYKVKCKECKASYVGETTRRLETRMTEHRRAVQRGETNILALADHAWRVNHQIDWNSTTVLGVNPRY